MQKSRENTRRWRGADLLAAPQSQESVLNESRFVSLKEHARVSVIVVTYNSVHYIASLIRNLRTAANHNSMRLVIVDNHSSDDTISIVEESDDILLIRSDENLGYAGGINVGMRHAGEYDHLLILNPDVIIAPDAIDKLLLAVDDEGIGAVAPLILDGKDHIVPSLHREPTLFRCLCDSIFSPKVCAQIGLPSETEFRRENYDNPHDVDWASGAALLIPGPVVREVGEWDESFFLYSEEVDYFRRIRERNLRIRFEPSSIVKHPGRGSGSSMDLDALRAVNRVRYVEASRGPIYAAFYRAAVALGHAMRAYKRVDRHVLMEVLKRSSWAQLPHRQERSVTCQP